jgi:AcrR family transcriptional regulator
MGRRSQHTPEELRELILKATRKVVEEDGMTLPSAREIARAIGYAPGTLYNMFENLTDILLHVESRVLTELENELILAIKGLKGRDAVIAFADKYIEFAFANHRLWQLIIRNQPESDHIIPLWYRDRMAAPHALLSRTLAAASPQASDEDVKQQTELIWTTMHGMIQVAMTRKFGQVSQDGLSTMMHKIIDGMFGAGGRAPIERSSRRNGAAGHTAA